MAFIGVCSSGLEEEVHAQRDLPVVEVSPDDLVGGGVLEDVAHVRIQGHSRSQEELCAGAQVLSEEIVGVVNISNTVMGAFRSAYLGYYAFAGFSRQGLMREGLRAVVKHAFGTLKLHRLEANIQPTNIASIALVRSVGFKLEGYSPRYLKIFGRWRDHERWAILAN